MSAAKRYVILKLGAHEPKFDDRCVVCKEPCGRSERILIKAWSANFMPGAEFAPTREFLVPAHVTSKNCSRKLLRQWWLVTHGFTAVAIVIAVAVGFLMWKLNRGMSLFYEVMLPVVIVGIAFYLYWKNHLEIAINEQMRDGEYMFTFDDCQYAESFERLNVEFQKK